MSREYVIQKGNRFSVKQSLDEVKEAAGGHGFTNYLNYIMQPGGTPDNDDVAKVVAVYDTWPLCPAPDNCIELTKYCTLGNTVSKRLGNVLKKLDVTPL